MKDRCPQSKKIGMARLSGYRWIISTRGYANVIESKEDFVEGVLFGISPSDEPSLDKKEGVAIGCFRKANLPVICRENEISELVYIDPIKTEGRPNEKYIQRINSGIEDADLSPMYIERYMRKFILAQ